MIQRLLKLKRKLLITIMINIFLLQNLIIYQKNFAARLAQVNLVTKIDFDTNLIRLSKKSNSDKAKHVIFENELKKLQASTSI